MKPIIEIERCIQPPRFYGLVSQNFRRDTYILAIYPINLILIIINFFTHTFKNVFKSIAINRLEAYEQGVKDGVEKERKRILKELGYKKE